MVLMGTMERVENKALVSTPLLFAESDHFSSVTRAHLKDKSTLERNACGVCWMASVNASQK